MDDVSLCEGCEHRSESRRRVQRFIDLRLSRGESAPFKGLPNDTAPKAECKQHELYGYEVGTRIVCRDFAPKAHVSSTDESEAPTTSRVSQPVPDGFECRGCGNYTTTTYCSSKCARGGL